MADSSMSNIGAVETYGKNLANVNQQMIQIFQKMRTQTESLRNAWNDDQFDRFRQDFDQDIMKKIREISVKMEMFSKYVEEMCKIHRMAQQNKYY
jgi:uncharacterized protein YukE